ncbi:MAG: hypothetical protein RIS86_1769 [Planctomycetota bacterium]|jgi:hypothetical protein
MTRAIALAAVPLALAGAAAAQEMLSMPAATQPSPGVVIPRVQGRAYAFEGAQWLLEQDLRVEYGLARDLSVSVDLPLYEGFLDAPGQSDGRFGLGDLDALVEWRFLREDLNAVDTVRASLFAGAEIPTGTGAYGGGSVDPCVGAVVTAIFGRHGIDASARWTFVTGDGMDRPVFPSDTPEDFANLDLGYAYRLAPESYGEERVAAWYATLELSATVATGGAGHLVTIGPGLLLEAPDHAVEIGMQLPLSSDDDGRPALRAALVLGLRLIF